MKKISVDEFIRHWPDNIASVFESNMFDFVTQAGDYSRRFFATSFPFQGFPKSGKPWAPRKRKKSNDGNRLILVDSGQLRSRINKDATKISKDRKRRADGTFFSKHKSIYEIWTGEGLSPAERITKKGKRRVQSKKGYAAIHNTDPRQHNFRANQYSSRKPVQRQFIGFSPYLNSRYKQLLPMIFKGFPHA